MHYRREIDGLRALAVLPVILFHAGFETFSGGFVGVDVFFVISGYLITTIITAELEQGNFSIVNFYERRARRILPALFVVMLACFVVGYFLLMPDEFKNLGQSFVSTIFFSNNILLAMTSGYWDLASEFKPLLHTWSLGVEEQYYVVIPILLMLCWKFSKWAIPYLLFLIFASSLLFSIWFVSVSPRWAFYMLPTRAWELAIGALAAVYMSSIHSTCYNKKLSNSLSLVGVLLIAISIFIFDETTQSPGYQLLMPTIGAVLIIIFCNHDSLAFKLLGNRATVFVGMLSYSLYLWHQPVFAYLRVYSIEPPSSLSFLIALPVIFLLSFLSWRIVETPFRDKLFINRRSVFMCSTVFSILFIVAGLYLNKSYGMPLRAFNEDIRIEDMDKRIYNERIFSFKKDSFSPGEKKKILVVGNSFGRDFVNITLESYDISNIDLVYRDDLGGCITTNTDMNPESLFVQADVIVFALGPTSGIYSDNCSLKNISFAEENGKKIYYVGTKDFGYNLNWLIQLKGKEKNNKYNSIQNGVIEYDLSTHKAIPSKYYISLLAPTLINGKIPVTDNYGRMLSTDRAHLTKYGAIYFGEKAVMNTTYSDVFK